MIVNLVMRQASFGGPVDPNKGRPQMSRSIGVTLANFKGKDEGVSSQWKKCYDGFNSSRYNGILDMGRPQGSTES